MFPPDSLPQRPNRDRVSGGFPGTLLRFVPMMIVMGAIIYSSLYPFAFHDVGSLREAIANLLASWDRSPQSSGDMLANLLFYMPLGLTVTQFFGRASAKAAAVIVAFALGAVFSLSLELAQFYEFGRFSALSDVYLNVTGSVCAALAWRAGSWRLQLSWPSDGAAVFARLLLLVWLAWRLYPYVPTVDLHKYWYSIQPLLHDPGDSLGTICRDAILWLSVICLARFGFAPKSIARWLLPAMACFFAAKIVIIGQYVGLPDVAGSALALVLYLSVRRWFDAAALPMVFLFLAVVVHTRILPWQLAPEPNAFQWIPFYGFLHGSLHFNIITFWQKFYLYGALLWLLVKAGMRLGLAVALECVLLLATGVAQIFLLGRSAEITDVLMALIVGLIYWALRSWSPAPAPALPRN